MLAIAPLGCVLCSAKSLFFPVKKMITMYLFFFSVYIAGSMFYGYSLEMGKKRSAVSTECGPTGSESAAANYFKIPNEFPESPAALSACNVL